MRDAREMKGRICILRAKIVFNNGPMLPPSSGSPGASCLPNLESELFGIGTVLIAVSGAVLNIGWCQKNNQKR